MNVKTLLSLGIVLSMMLAVMPLVAVKAVPTASMEIVFENGLHEITKNVCNNFVVTLKIVETPPISQWITEITWDPAVLELVHAPPSKADVHQGDFLSSAGSTVFLIKTPELGRLPEITCATLGLETNSGTGTLATIDFHAKGPGDSPITLVRHNLLNGITPVPCDKVDGLVHVPTPPATPPKAIFEPEDGTLITVCTDVVLDGSASTPGYDTLPPPGETCPITEYKWEIDIGNDGTIEMTLYGMDNSFHCDGPGVVAITLTVTAPDLTPPPAPTYVDHDSEKHLIMQVVPSVGADIDVYTEKGGMGDLGPYPFGWSDAYGPQEEVTVHAKVTYNDEPVEYKPVAFEMNDPNGVARDFRVAFTDSSGVATVSFRIPWEGSGAEDLFGNWYIYGDVSISEETVQDVVAFRFGYIVSIRSIAVAPSSLHKLDTMTVDVDLQSISMNSRTVFLTLVACDECNVPIGLATATFTVDPEDGVSLGHTITIPSWAFVGTGMIYVNVFTIQPYFGGVPYCPEDSAIFIVLNTPP